MHRNFLDKNASATQWLVLSSFSLQSEREEARAEKYSSEKGKGAVRGKCRKGKETQHIFSWYPEKSGKFIQ